MKIDLVRCGWKEIRPNKFVFQEATTNAGILPATKAQYITHSSLRRMK